MYLFLMSDSYSLLVLGTVLKRSQHANFWKHQKMVSADASESSWTSVQSGSKWLGRHEVHSYEPSTSLRQRRTTLTYVWRQCVFVLRWGMATKYFIHLLCLSCWEPFIWVNGRWKEIATENSVDFRYQFKWFNLIFFPTMSWISLW